MESNMESNQLTLPSQAGQMFPFRRLPTEVRLMVWRMALPDPRAVELRTSQRHKGYYTTARNPSLFYVNQEARNEALRFYTLTFGTDDAPARVYFDFEADVLFYNPGYFEKPWNADEDGDFDEYLPEWELPKGVHGIEKIKKLAASGLHCDVLAAGALGRAVHLEVMMVLEQDYREYLREASDWQLREHQGSPNYDEYRHIFALERQSNVSFAYACFSMSAEYYCTDHADGSRLH
jgi:hypothetical protein